MQISYQECALPYNFLVASAGLDRLMDRAEVISILSPSFRSQGRTNLFEEVQTLNPEP